MSSLEVCFVYRCSVDPAKPPLITQQCQVLLAKVIMFERVGRLLMNRRRACLQAR